MKLTGNGIINSLLLAIIILVTTSCAVWNNVINIFSDDLKTGSDAPSLTTNEVIQGLKEALVTGTGNAINSLGRPNGFFRNPDVKIPMPDSLEKVEDALRTLHQDKIVDEFILTMNRAAEQAVPETAHIFSDAIGSMTFEDAWEILHGPDDSATRYFENNSVEELTDKILPLIKITTNATGVTAKYKKMVGKLEVASKLINEKSLDLDRYVTDKTLDGLFRILAAEERRIRNDPVARTSAILKKVFGS
jgi:hypothetical protein